ncbi:MAG: FMN-binding protein [Clostridia bacterium]|nr:FMN-binding protein [Clostridia bacterium]
MSEQATATKKGMPEMARLVLVLFAISAITALLLGLANMVTAPAIAANELAKKNAAMASVLPADTYTPVEYTGSDLSIAAINQAGDAGYVVEVNCGGSFSGTLSIMVGVNADGTCSGVEIIKTAETSGLGANAGKEDWRAQFVGKVAGVSVAKDGGEINALTGATITSRAVSNGVNSAIAAAASMG